MMMMMTLSTAHRHQCPFSPASHRRVSPGETTETTNQFRLREAEGGAGWVDKLASERDRESEKIDRLTAADVTHTGRRVRGTAVRTRGRGRTKECTLFDGGRGRRISGRPVDLLRTPSCGGRTVDVDDSDDDCTHDALLR